VPARRVRLVLSLLAGGIAACAARAADAPTGADGAAVLDQFRRMVWTDATYAEFDLREMPRRGQEHLFHGRFWGTRNDRGPVTRVELDVGKGGFTHRFLIQGGPDAGLWTSDGPGAGTPDPDALLSPVVPGVEMTPFDLLPMPYLYWLDAGLVGVQRVRGRKAYVYMMTPPGEFLSKYPKIKSVRVYLDAQYEALEQSEVIGPAGKVAKTLSLLELRKVGPRWIPKDLDIRDETTRNKTRLTLTAIAVGMAAEPPTFDPSLLGSAANLPSAALITRIMQ
jgi:hypothetical protein